MDAHQNAARNTSFARDAATLALGSMIVALFAACWRTANQPRPAPAAAPAAPDPVALPDAGCVPRLS